MPAASYTASCTAQRCPRHVRPARPFLMDSTEPLHTRASESAWSLWRSLPSSVSRLLRERGWRNLRLLSSANNSYNRDYHGGDKKDSQLPALNVFARRGGKIHRCYCTELLFAPFDQGQDGRHVDLIWPLWNLFDFAPEGRGKDWHDKLSYDS
jgi:predicted dithiol-disulfide oxidoreductase (DUF899 family)